MKAKAVFLSLVTLPFATSIWASNLSTDTAPFLAQVREETYVMDIRPADAKSGGKPTLARGVVRHGRWIYSTADGSCEQLEIKLNGFILIPTTYGAVVQQPDTLTSKTSVSCPQQGAPSANGEGDAH